MTTFRNDYTPSTWKQKHIMLYFSIPSHTDEPVLVSSLIDYEAMNDGIIFIELQGEMLNDDEFISLELQVSNDYSIPLLCRGYSGNSKFFELPKVFQKGEEIKLCCNTKLHPSKNKTLMGLYVSNGRYYTQCEPEGFRHITYCIDRPDELATFNTFIKFSNSEKILTLCNGNLASPKEENKKNLDFWQDTIPKPTYLFALVIAKDLESIQEEFTTMSGKKVKLGLYSEKKDVKRLHHAMNALKDSMKWDEKVYEREVDTAEYNIVAVDDFNMGAMENKNLNIFNTAFVLADKDIATDVDFLNVSSVVAHEYFHNWTGNRVTCRDWFQLTLKEGLTVYRDQCFTDTITKTARLDDIKTLKSIQWAEDSGPMKHAIRPDSYETINNFYTSTIYEKGAEVIRMLHKLVGDSAYQKALTYYFDTFDGKAVTCDDFLASFIVTAETEKHKELLQQFGNWYSQVGKVTVHFEWCFNAEKKTISITLKQFSDNKPSELVIPIDSVALINAVSETSKISEFNLPLMILTDSEQVFEFSVEANETNEVLELTLLKGFSAPVELLDLNSSNSLNNKQDNSSNNLENFLKNKQYFTDDYLIYNEFQHYFKLFLSGAIEGIHLAEYVQLFFDKQKSNSNYRIIAQTLTLPSFDEVIGFMKVSINPQNYIERRKALESQLKSALEWKIIHQEMQVLLAGKPYDFKDADIRRLKNLALSYVADSSVQQNTARQQLETADNLTDRLAALRLLMNERQLFNEFYDTWKEEALIIDKWFGVQAQNEQVLQLVDVLLNHEAFYRQTPNRCRSLLMNLFKNPVFFHQKNGQGYQLWASEIMKINDFNPQLASRLARCMEQWQVFDIQTQTLMKEQIQLVADYQNLSTDVREVIEKMLGK